MEAVEEKIIKEARERELTGEKVWLISHNAVSRKHFILLWKDRKRPRES